MKIELIFSIQWWSVGESLANINLAIFYIEKIKTDYPDKFHIILNFSGFDLILNHAINHENIKLLTDEFYINNVDYSYDNICNNKKFKRVHDFCAVFSEKYDENIEHIFQTKNIGDNIILSKMFNDYFNFDYHVINKIRHYVPILGDDQIIKPDELNTNKFKILCGLSKNLEEITQNILNSKNINKFESIHFRWNEHIPHPCQHDVINYWLDRISPFIEKGKTYFLSSNTPMFYDLFEIRFKNCFYINRGNHNNKSPNSILITDFLPKNVNFNQYKINEIYDYIAHIELSIICNGNIVYNLTDGVREMISLFLWVPILQYNVDLIWITFYHSVHRKYVLDGCYYQSLLNSNYMEIEIPKCVCDITHKRLCEENKKLDV